MTALLLATIVASMIVLLVAFYLGFKYPGGWPEWPHDSATTVRYAISGILFLLIIGLIYWVTRFWDYPVGGRALTYLSFAVIPILLVLALFLPEGWGHLKNP